MGSKLDLTGLPVVQVEPEVDAEEVAEAGGDHASLHGARNQSTKRRQRFQRHSHKAFSGPQRVASGLAQLSMAFTLLVEYPRTNGCRQYRKLMPS